MDTIISNSPQETSAAGFALAQNVGPGAVIALFGEMGAGKTHFTKGLVHGLGGNPDEVSSPTFTLVHEYREGRVPVFHFDLYRLESPSELLQIGWDDYLDGGGIVVVEWPERFPSLLPGGAVTVRFQMQSETVRLLEVSR